jgi:carbon-monoxide dehydrogenase medium subunit
VQLTVDGGRIASARVALGSAGITPIRAAEAEKELTGQDVKKVKLDKAAEAAIAAADPVEDQRGSAEFKKRLVGVLTRRAAGIALRRANGETVKNSHEYY